MKLNIALPTSRQFSLQIRSFRCGIHSIRSVLITGQASSVQLSVLCAEGRLPHVHGRLYKIQGHRNKSDDPVLAFSIRAEIGQAATEYFFLGRLWLSQEPPDHLSAERPGPYRPAVLARPRVQGRRPPIGRTGQPSVHASQAVGPGVQSGFGSSGGCQGVPGKEDYRDWVPSTVEWGDPCSQEGDILVGHVEMASSVKIFA